MSNQDSKLARRVRSYPTFAADQSLAAVRQHLPEVSAVRSKLVRAVQTDALAEALAELTPYEALAMASVANRGQTAYCENNKTAVMRCRMHITLCRTGMNEPRR